MSSPHNNNNSQTVSNTRQFVFVAVLHRGESACFAERLPVISFPVINGNVAGPAAEEVFRNKASAFDDQAGSCDQTRPIGPDQPRQALAGFDLREGVERLGNKPELYAKLLKAFVESMPIRESGQRRNGAALSR